MNVKSKLAFSYGIIILIFIILVSLSAYSLSQIDKNVKKILDKNMPQKQTISKTILLTQQTISNLKTYVMSYDESNHIQNTISQDLRSLSRHLKELKQYENINQEKINDVIESFAKLKLIIQECESVHMLKIDLHFKLYQKIYDVEKYFFRLQNKKFNLDFYGWYKDYKIKNKKIKNYIDQYAKAYEKNDTKLLKEYSLKVIKTSARTLDMIEDSERINFENLMNEIALISKKLHGIENIIDMELQTSKNDISNTMVIHSQLEILLLIIGVLITLLTSLFVSRSIIGSLHSFKSGLLSFFKFINNETKTLDPIDLNTKDEFGEMARELNKNIQHSSRLHTELISLKENLEERVNQRTKELEIEKNYTQKLLDTNPDIIIVSNDHEIVSTNSSFFNFFKFDTLDDFKKTHESISEYFITFNDKPFPKDNMIEDVHWTQYIINHNAIVKLTTENRTFYFDIAASKLDDEEILIILSDITVLKHQESILKVQAYTDALTSLHNRKSYDEKIEELLSEHKRYDTPFSMIIFDIDKFKSINDTYGHKVGDEVLIDISELITSSIRTNDFIFRIGGEEFVILLKQTNKDQASILAEKIRRRVENELKTIKDKTITISLGITEIEKNDTQDSIFTRADEALYEAKNSGRNKAVLA